MIDLDTFIITSAAEKSTTGACEKGKIVVYFFGMSYRKGGRPAGRRRASMSDLREVLQENSYLRQKQLIFADCDRYQRARVQKTASKVFRIPSVEIRCRALDKADQYVNNDAHLNSSR